MNIIKSKKITWVDIKGPNKKDLAWIKKNFNLHPLILRELMPSLDYPKIENFGNYLFIVIFYPFFDRKTQQTVPFELDIIISKNYIITSHYKDIVPLKKIFDRCNLYEEIKKEYFQEGTGKILYEIMQEVLSAYFPKLVHMKENLENLEKMVYKRENKEAVDYVSLVRRDIIGFQQITEPQKLLLKNLAKESVNFFSKGTIPYFHNLINVHEQVSSILGDLNQTLSALDSTNQSLLTTRTNEIIKILTIFSVIVFPLTLLAGIFGMNTGYLPFVGRPYDFWLITGAMLAGAAIMLIIFRVKKWL